MPLTKAGRRVLRHFEQEYPGRGKSVFYASMRAGRLPSSLERRNPILPNPRVNLLPYLIAGGALYWWWARQRPVGVGNTPQAQNQTRLPQSPQLPTSTINATYPSDTAQAFAAYPRSVVLQGSSA
jgi:hypothetical protein